MKFKTSDLITKIDEAIKADLLKEAEWEKSEDIKEERRVSEWVRINGAAIHHFGVYLTALDNEVLTADIIAGYFPHLSGYRHRNGEIPVYDRERRSKYSGIDRVRLTHLKSILESIQDEYVTTTSLRDIGFKDVGRLFNW